MVTAVSGSGDAGGSGFGTITSAPLTGTGSVGLKAPSLTPQQVLAQRESTFQQVAGVMLKDAGAALQWYRQTLTSVHVVGGIVDSIVHDLFNGPILFDPTQRSVAYDIGRLIGDGISIMLGLGATAAGLTALLGSVVLDATGVGALALAATAEGAVILTRSVDYGLQDTRALYSKIESGGTEGTGQVRWTTNENGLPVGGKITGYTVHGTDQALGRDSGRGVSNEAIQETVTNPQEVVEQPPTKSGYGPTYKYVGKNTVVVLNSEGKVVTVIGKSSQVYRNGW
ncbi:MAG: hypothetical protein ACYCYO_18870 [Bacilli bacterium]